MLMLVPATAQAATTDLAITKTDSPDPVREGQVLTYTIAVMNEGPAAATGVTLSDKLSNQVDFVSVESSQGTCDRNGRNVNCDLGTLAADPYAQAATVTIKVRPSKDGQITNTATVEAGPDDTDPNPANNSASETTTVRPPAGGGGGGAPQCAGRTATIVGNGGSNTLVGGPGRDVIKARGGNDRIRGLGGNDIVCAGGGNDRVKGGAGDDRLKGGRGRDRLKGGNGDDVLAGGPGNDKCRGGSGNDTERSC
jgi:uncharacterized repeat protein (TIGR01451 family)